MKTKNTQKGFTLIELILSISLLATILITATFFASSLLEGRVKNNSLNEVNQQGAQVMEFITRSIRNADTLTSPTIGATTTSITLDTTTIELNNDSIEVAVGANPAVALTNSNVIASSLSFQNLTQPDSTSSVIRTSLTLEYNSSSARDEYDISKTFTSSAILRSN